MKKSCKKPPPQLHLSLTPKSLDEVQAEICARSLRDYVRAAWPILEPDTVYTHGWHIDCICDHLEAATRGEIRKLIINVPPRSMKSLNVSVFWPSWVWIRRPASRWLTSSYAEDLAVKHAVDTRTVLRSTWYQGRWGKNFKLSGDQDVKSRYTNTATGGRLAVGVGSRITGFGGDYLVCDDPHNVMEAESDEVRKKALTWFDRSFSTRVNDRRTSVRVVVMQRLHTQDLTGHLLAQGGWVHVCLPMEYDGRRCVTVLGDCDPRTKDGDLLWPAKVPASALPEMKVELGTYGVAGQLQQKPVPAGGAIIKSSWFRYYTRPDKEDSDVIQLGTRKVKQSEMMRFVICDPAVEEKQENDYTVIGAFGIVRQNPSILVWLDALREQMDADVILPNIRRMMDRWLVSFCGLETIHFQKMIFQMARKKGLRFREISTSKEALVRIDKDKVARTYAAAPFIEAGRLWLPQPALSWQAQAEGEITTFPKAPHDDVVDVMDNAVAVADHFQALVPHEESQDRKPTEDEDRDADQDDEDENKEPPLLPWREKHW